MDKEKEVMMMYKVIGSRLKNCKDPYDTMGHKDIQICLCRLFHVPKQFTNRIIEELISLGFIEKLGKNQLGILYKVVD